MLLQKRQNPCRPPFLFASPSIFILLLLALSGPMMFLSLISTELLAHLCVSQLVVVIAIDGSILLLAVTRLLRKSHENPCACYSELLARAEMQSQKPS